jgi:L-2-hydroxycarboxylate dehydrogenase (NAD+)
MICRARANIGELRALSERLLMQRGAPEDAARLQADLLVEAELRGLPSHGLQRLPRLLLRLERGLANPRTTGAALWTKPAVLTVDGEAGLGPVVMMAAIRQLARKIPVQGIALAAIRNANHIGMLAYYAEAAAQMGFASIVISTSEALVHPYGGTQPMLGTNPIAIGIPTATEPFILDLATSTVSMGKIHHHALCGEAIPTGWAVDSEGRPTTDAEAAKAGAIAPFGGAKGYGLGLAVELLVAALAGSAFAPEVTGTLDDHQAATKGDVVILIDPAAGRGEARQLSAFLQRVRASRPSEPGRSVAISGDGGRGRRAKALATGVELPDEIMETLAALDAARHH